jgi:hypothetical protein
MLVFSAQGATEIPFGDWQNPGSSGDITRIQFEFVRVIAKYGVWLQEQGKLSRELTEIEKRMSPVQGQMLFRQTR